METALATPAAAEAPVSAPAETMDSALNDLANMMTGTEETPPGESPTAPPPSGEPVPAHPGGEGPSSEASPAAQPTDAPVEYQLSPDGNHYLVPKDKIGDVGQLPAVREYYAKVQEKFPTVGDAEEAYSRASQFGLMNTDFLYGDDNGIDNFLAYLTGKGVDPAYPDLANQFKGSFVKMAQRMPDTLRSVDPQAHYNFTDSLIKQEIDAAYSAAAESGNPEHFKAAQWLDYGWNGKYRTELGKPDPAAQQTNVLTQREQGIQQRESQLLERDWTAFNSSKLEGAKWQEFNAELDRTLAPVKDKYDATIWPHVRDGIRRDVLAKMTKNEAWAGQHSGSLRGLKATYDQLWKAGKSPDALTTSARAYINDFMIQARRAIPEVSKALLSKTPPAKAGTPQQVPAATARPNTPARAPNGQFVEQQKADYEKEVEATAGMLGW